MNFKDGAKAGAGAYIGWTLARWFTTIIAALIVCGVTCAVCVSNPDRTDNMFAALGDEKAQTEVMKREASKAKSEGRNVRTIVFSTGCRVRKHPMLNAKKVGRIEVGETYHVIGSKKVGNRLWRNIILPTGKRGWTGCTP